MKCYICGKDLFSQEKYEKFRACDKTSFVENWHWVCGVCKDKIIGGDVSFPYLDFEMLDEKLYDKGER